ncbi:hypothetical protein [Candidatus Enterococcus ferrettii]|uniref:DUF4179 domain-containing protein n=1 Tax=Candidatus Enterococcus ferrettii TaxID=2815324 RepID=A0ABV0EJT7_9ENTE|nr:hypothetical protein [Enterococcus sp. 665A]MBO1338229.1 hypothetical protein [Enterococcus sp. 665A]
MSDDSENQIHEQKLETEKFLLEKEKFELEKRKQKLQWITSIVSTIVLIFSLGTSLAAVKSQEKTIKLQQKNIEILSDANEFEKSNTHPVFEFSETKLPDKSIKHDLVLKRGEMNNVDFSISFIIRGTIFYEGLNYEFHQTIMTNDFDRKGNEFSVTSFVNLNTKTLIDEITKMAHLEGLDVSMSPTTSSIKYYTVSYMNFEHQLKEEYYIAYNGKGRATESPYSEKNRFLNSETHNTLFFGGGTTIGNSSDGNLSVAKTIYEKFKHQLD